MLHHIIYKNDNPDLPWVVFIHGAGGSSTIWYKQISPFRKNFNLLLIDLRGHGRTETIDEINNNKEYSFRAISQEVFDVMDHLHIQKAHFIGVSLGTLIIRQLVEIDPSRIQSMVLSGAITQLNLLSKTLIVVGNTLKKVVPFMFLYALFAFIILPRRNHAKSRAVFIHEAKKLKKTEFIRWFGLTKSLAKTLKKFEFQQHQLPVLFISGRQDHMFIQHVQEMAKKEEKGKMVTVEDCGHIVNIEQAATFNEVVIAYLNQSH
jgi:pimeloyl-ACP methyl ester carboxylesterase